jgi:uncharacterized Zn finger protein
MTNTDYKACKKCGCKSIWVLSKGDGVIVACINCGTEGMIGSTLSEAKELWNQEPER